RRVSSGGSRHGGADCRQARPPAPDRCRRAQERSRNTRHSGCQMIDIQFLRNDMDGVVAAMRRRNFAFDPAEFQSLEAERKTPQTRTQELQAKRNALSKQIGMLKGNGEDASAVMAEVAGLGDELKASEHKLAELLPRIEAITASMPNPPDASVPDGKDETDNVEISRVGTPRAFDFEPLDHVDVGAALGLDFEVATK